MFELARRAALSNVGVICTQSDVSILYMMTPSALLTPRKDIRPNEAREDWPSERARITRLENDIANHKRDIASIDEEIREFTEEPIVSTDDARELLEIQQRLRRAT